jgi:hypothetical protein
LNECPAVARNPGAALLLTGGDFSQTDIARATGSQAGGFRLGSEM